MTDPDPDYDADMADKPRMGRPLRSDEVAIVISLRVTPAEKAAWLKAAGKEALSDWIRDRCNRSASRR